jgi:hypothetical protein
MPLVGFEPTTPVFVWPGHALDREATAIGFMSVILGTYETAK